MMVPRPRARLALLLALLSACGPPSPEAPSPEAPSPGASPAGPASQPAALRPVPVIALDLLEPSVRDQLAASRTELDALLVQPRAEPAQLVRVLGEVGQLYHAYGFHEAAEACYLNLLQLAGPSFRWQYYLAQLYLTTGETEQALPWLRQALALQPADVPALVTLGRTLADLGQPEPAEQVLHEALKQQPGIALAHFTLGQLAAERGDFPSAVEEYRTVLRLQPAASSVHLPLADAYRANGDAEAARRELELRGDGAIVFADPLMQELRQLTTGARRYIDEGMAASREGRYADAEAAFRQALEADPDNATAHLNLGSVRVQLGRTQDALKSYETALRLEPENSRAHFNMGTLLSAIGEEAGATEHFERAIELYPGYRAAHFNLANLRLRQGRFREAREGFATVVELEPANVEARQGEAICDMQLGRWQEARQRLEEGLQVLPGNRVLTHALARLLATAGDPKVRDGARALALAKSLLATNSELQHIETLAMAFAETGDFAQAIHWQEAALDAVRSSRRQDLLAPLEANLARYRNGQPCRQPWHASAFGGHWG